MKDNQFSNTALKGISNDPTNINWCQSEKSTVSFKMCCFIFSCHLCWKGKLPGAVRLAFLTHYYYSRFNSCSDGRHSDSRCNQRSSLIQEMSVILILFYFIFVTENKTLIKCKVYKARATSWKPTYNQIAMLSQARQACMASQQHIMLPWQSIPELQGWKQQQIICCSPYVSIAGQVETQANRSRFYREGT